jgi:hypothetical protein
MLLPRSFFQVGEERADRLGVQVGDLQLVRLAAGPGGGEGEQQGEGVAVGRDGGGAGLPLDDQLAGEEALEQGGQAVHGCPPKACESRAAARASSSGEADMYQYDDLGSTCPR